MESHSIERLRQLLTDIRPYVWVVGGYARGEQATTDLDLYIRPRERHEEGESTYKDEIAKVLRKYGLKWRTPCERSFWVNGDLPIPVHISRRFRIPSYCETFNMKVFGVWMVATLTADMEHPKVRGA